MNQTQNITADQVDEAVFKRITTGIAAQRQLASQQHNFARNPEKYADLAFPLETRARRRFHKVEEARQARKGRKAYIRRELAKERAASDLANLFSLIDAGPNLRAQQAINARINYLADEDLAAALKANREPLTLDQIEAQLREVAKTGVVRSPKAVAV